MITTLLDLLFGCWHWNYSFPIKVSASARRKIPAAKLTGTYVVCLECGKEFSYDWDGMKVITEERREEFLRSRQAEA